MEQRFRKFKKFNDLEEFIELKNKISLTNSRANDIPLTIDATDKEIKISALLANQTILDQTTQEELAMIQTMGKVPLIAKTLKAWLE